MENKLNGQDKMMPLAMEDVKKAYMERVYTMSHAELFHELMRVHHESSKLLQAAEEEINKVRDALSRYEPIH